MTPPILEHFLEGSWRAPARPQAEIRSAVDGAVVALAATEAPDLGAALRHARAVGGPALRRLTFPERARILRALAEALMARKGELYELGYAAGCTKGDSWFDVDGGAGALFSYASLGRRQLPDGKVIIEGEPERLSKGGSFTGQHILTSRHGCAVQINAFNFPVWGFCEKLGPALLAGMPSLIKPATATAYITEHAIRILLEAGVLPEGAVQLVCGPVGDLFEHLDGQDVVSFTGSAATAAKLQSHPVIAREAVRFVAERDSLNAAILGPDAGPGTPEFDLFVKEVVREMTVKAGQKCTAIRRVLAPAPLIEPLRAALAERLAKITIGDPRREEVRMGALVSQGQRVDVREKVAALRGGAALAFGDPAQVEAVGADAEAGAFLSPLLLFAERPDEAHACHEVEAFGPVATLMPYRDLGHAVKLANQGKGSLVLSLVTHDPAVAVEVVHGAAAQHGRVLVLDRDCAQESTGHGSPLPLLVHGGPGRAGGGEEMGGVRGVAHYMQRTAVQGSPRMLTAVTGEYAPGAPTTTGAAHPFRKRLSELEIGYSFFTPARTITLADIEHFAEFTGDTFYAHMDEEAAAANPLFGGRVAHGYLILSFAAGLFVDAPPGPVLANYGLERLRFIKPMKPGDAMKVALTVKSKKQTKPDMGEVRWSVTVTNQDDELTAAYELLTMNAV
jgi:oxepin-CoA hydrolase/3-oxo-5,6-dehydrosuberyl-CoA semialdehyde dehydrogenase